MDFVGLTGQMGQKWKDIYLDFYYVRTKTHEYIHDGLDIYGYVTLMIIKNDPDVHRIRRPRNKDESLVNMSAWLGARLWYLHSVSDGAFKDRVSSQADTIVLRSAFDLIVQSLTCSNVCLNHVNNKITKAGYGSLCHNMDKKHGYVITFI